VSPEERCFIDAILANPDDDTPRLVYADWLDEREGDVTCPRCLGLSKPYDSLALPKFGCKECGGCGTVRDTSPALRAEFIRVQCELARTPEPDILTIGRLDGYKSWEDETSSTCRSCRNGGRVCRSHELDRRARDLLRGDAVPGEYFENWVKWFLDVLPILPWDDRTWGTGYGRPVRGFVEDVTCTAEWWLKNGDAVCKAQPVTKVELTTRPKMDFWGADNYSAALADARKFECTRWRGVKFHLPPRVFVPAGLEEVARNILAATNQPGGYVPPCAAEYEQG
jgi:uncharacterized protein (TIGR02996 family)